MKRLRVLLVNPHYKAGGLDGLILSPPLGLFSLSNTVKDLCEVEILDLKAVSLKKEQIREKIKFYSPDLVGISMTMTPSVYSALEIASLAKEQDILVVAGGHHATYESENLLGDNIDIVIRGEGEVTFRELISKLSANEDFANIQGLSFFRNGKIFRNQDRIFERNLDIVSKPNCDKSFFNGKLSKYPYHFLGSRMGSIETSRGCLSACKFCSVKSFYKRTWRKCSEQKVIDEIVILYQNGLKNIFIIDDNFTSDVGRVFRICNLLEGKNMDGLNFFCQARVDVIAKNPEMVKKMASAGFSLVFLGIESPSSGNLANMQKKINSEQVRNAIKILRDNKIAIWGAFIIGNRNETLEDIRKTLKYALSLDIDLAQFTAMTPLPGTEFFEEIKNRLITNDYRKFDFLNCVFRPNSLEPNEVERQLRKAYRQFYFRLRKWKFLMSSQNEWIKNLRHWPPAYLKAARILIGITP